MNSLLVSVLGSVLGGIVLILGASLVSPRLRQILTAAAVRLLNIDVEQVFATPRAAEADLRHELERAQSLHLLTGRGNELQREVFEPVLGKTRSSRLHDIVILLPCTEHEPEGVDWVEDRENEVAAFDPAFGGGALREQIRANARFLQPFASRGLLDLRRYDLPHLGRILITDRCAYLTPYPTAAHSRDSRVIKYSRGADMYDFLERTFQKFLAASHPDVPSNGPPGT